MTSRQGDGFIVLRPEGDLCEGPESDRVEAVLARWGRKKQCVIVDLSRTRQLSARGLGILVRAHQESIEQGGQVVACDPSAHHLWLLRITGIAKFVAVYETKAAAIAALSPQAPKLSSGVIATAPSAIPRLVEAGGAILLGDEGEDLMMWLLDPRPDCVRSGV